MQTQIRRYNIVVKGRVQDVGAGVEIESLQQREIAGDFDLPVRLVKLSTDEMYDIDRKLGIGNEYLKEIKHDTSTVQELW